MIFTYVKQYKNLIILSISSLAVLILLLSDPLGFYAQRAHDRAVIYNAIMVERAQTEKRIAIIKAEAEAELERIRLGTQTTSKDRISEDVK